MKSITGTVVSDKMQKSIVVEVVTRWQHPLYKKVVKRSKKYIVHDEKEKAKVGDKVSISGNRPISRRKRWVLEKIIDKGTKVKLK